MPRKSQCLTYDGRPKFRHATRDLAVEQMWVLIRRGSWSKGLGVYRCDQCAGWHVGRSYRPTGRKRRVGIARTA